MIRLSAHILNVEYSSLKTHHVFQLHAGRGKCLLGRLIIYIKVGIKVDFSKYSFLSLAGGNSFTTQPVHLCQTCYTICSDLMGMSFKRKS